MGVPGRLEEGHHQDRLDQDKRARREEGMQVNLRPQVHGAFVLRPPRKLERVTTWNTRVETRFLRGILERTCGWCLSDEAKEGGVQYRVTGGRAT